MTELIWDGKYDKDGKKVAPLCVALPFQTVETINESAQERQRMLDLFSTGRDPEWRNRLIWGDNKYVLSALLEEFLGQVDLVYIDPPFLTGADFSFLVQVNGESFTKEASIIEEKAYRDTWGRGRDSYVQMIHERLSLMYDLLNEEGSIFIHIGVPISHLVRSVAEEIFGVANFQSEVAWQRHDPHNDAVSRFGAIHDNILWFSKGPEPRYYFDKVREELSPAAEKEFSLLELEDGTIVNYRGNEHLKGRRFKLDDATWKGTNPARRFVWRGATPSDKREWMYDHEEMEAALARREFHLRDPEKGAARCRKRYLDENKGILLQDIWTNAGRMKGGSQYPTQKPEPLLSRIIKACSKEGDLVLDCFVGSGTAAVVAEQLNRRWIACDLSRFAIHLTRKRLLDIPNVRPFVVQNLGKYERQLWQAAEFGEAAQAKAASYRLFILDLYKATPVSGYTWLHGLKGGRMVHVGAVDSPVSPGDVSQIATEFRRAMGTGKDAPKTNGVDVLGWDFAFELNEVAKQQAAQANIDVRFLRIPRDVMDKRAVEQGDVRFFELAALSVDVQQSGQTVTVAVTDFVIPPDDVPEDVQRAITHWEQWIDYWAVDWDNKGDTFHNQWQDYRTRKKRELQKSVSHTYDEPSEHTIVVKAIDILGNDTTKTIKVKVAGDGAQKASAARAARPA